MFGRLCASRIRSMQGWPPCGRQLDVGGRTEGVRHGLGMPCLFVRSVVRAPPRLAGNYGASRLCCLRESTHEACETVLDGFHALLRTQHAMRQAEGVARGVTSLH